MSDEIEIRAYRDADQARVLELLQSTFGAWPDDDLVRTGSQADFFRWKHLDGPSGRSFMFVAEIDGRLIGFRSLMAWRLIGGDRVVRAAQGADIATHRDYRRIGLFSRLTRESDAIIGDAVDLYFGTPNDQSLGLTMKMGWHRVGELRQSLRICRPLRFTAAMLAKRVALRPRGRPAVEAELAADVLSDEEGISDLLAADQAFDSQLTTAKDLAYLSWRYAGMVGYNAVYEEQAGRLRGLAIFRVRPSGRLWEALVAELIVPPGDRQMARRLLGRVAKATRVDQVRCSFSPGSAQAQAASRYAFVGARGSRTLTAKAALEIAPEPYELGSWRLSLGDFEAF